MPQIVHGSAPPAVMLPPHAILGLSKTDHAVNPMNILIAAGDAAMIRDAVDTEGGRRVVEVASSGADFLVKSGKPNQVYVIGQNVGFPDLPTGEYKPDWRTLVDLAISKSRVPVEYKVDAGGIRMVGDPQPIIFVTGMEERHDPIFKLLLLYDPSRGYGGINEAISRIEEDILPNQNY
ncbi:MAG: hypothetical protein ABIH11_00385 [Candidatus Altiarchaeota archaeon]